MMYGGDDPVVGHTACLTPDGKRTWANTTDKDVMAEMIATEFCGRRVAINGKGELN